MEQWTFWGKEVKVKSLAELKEDPQKAGSDRFTVYTSVEYDKALGRTAQPAD